MTRMADEAEPASPACAFRASVVVPMRNRETFIAPLLESLLAQWRPDFELILIDDASEDATLATAMQVLERHPAVDVVITRLGHKQGMQMIGMLLATMRGQILIQADSDDIAFSDRFAQLLRCFDACEDCRLVTSNAALLSTEGLCCGLCDTRLPDAVLRDPRQAGLVGWDLRRLGATMAFHRDVFDMFAPIDPELCPYGLDLVLPLRATLIGSHHYLATPLVGWRQHRDNTHRLAGALEESPRASEQYRALELMALAQNIRDVESLSPKLPAGAFEALLADLRERFAVEFERWCRLRTRVMRDGIAESGGTREPAFVPAIAPIVSLRAGDTLRFSQDDARSRLAAAGAGFHFPEDWGMWTERLALFNVRIDPAGASLVRFDLILIVPAEVPDGRLAVCVDGQGWVEGVVDEQRRLPMSVVCR